MTDVENRLNDGEFFADSIDTPAEGVEQYRKRQFLKDVINKVKVVGEKKSMTKKLIDTRNS